MLSPGMLWGWGCAAFTLKNGKCPHLMLYVPLFNNLVATSHPWLPILARGTCHWLSLPYIQSWKFIPIFIRYLIYPIHFLNPRLLGTWEQRNPVCFLVILELWKPVMVRMHLLTFMVSFNKMGTNSSRKLATWQRACFTSQCLTMHRNTIHLRIWSQFSQDCFYCEVMLVIHLKTVGLCQIITIVPKLLAAWLMARTFPPTLPYPVDRRLQTARLVSRRCRLRAIWDPGMPSAVFSTWVVSGLPSGVAIPEHWVGTIEARLMNTVQPFKGQTKNYL